MFDMTKSYILGGIDSSMEDELCLVSLLQGTRVKIRADVYNRQPRIFIGAVFAVRGE